ncbi:MAG: D-glycero-beta-D-manno-heptose-7-phosphate kinase, partial [Zetaproteobacteria bacterium CG_4_8_14_3_um_filter_59_5]
MILVVGDIIVDEFVMGDVSRISPEAPVPVVHVDSIERRLGGSANVVRNLHAVDAHSAMFGLIGDDEPGRWVMQQLGEMDSESAGVVVKKNNRPTAIKTRVIARHQQVVRYDREWIQPASEESRKAIIGRVQASLGNADAVILSDYGKGVLSPDTMRELMPLLAGHIVCIDPKPVHT